MWFLQAIVFWAFAAGLAVLVDFLMRIYEDKPVKEVDEGPHFYAVKTIKLD